jgi:hypothetical protein
MFMEAFIVMLVSGGCGANAPKAVSAPGTCAPDPSASASKTPLQIPFENVGGHIVIPVTVNGSRPLRMVLDTGMSGPVVILTSREIGKDLGFEDGTPIQLAGAGGGPPVAARSYPYARIGVGGVEHSGQNLIVLDDEGPPSACTQDGIIGKSIFDRYAVDIDYGRTMITLYDPASAARSAREVLPLTFQSGIPVVDATVVLEDGRTVPVRLVVDFGAGHALSLDVGGAKKIVAPRRTVGEVVGTGILGDVEGQIGRIRALRLGSFEFQDVVTSFTSPTTGTTCGADGVKADGNLGTGILSRFDVAVDYRNARLLLSPNDAFKAPFEYNMAGLALAPGRDGTLLVRTVVPGSPAAMAGIVAGDHIRDLDGRDTKDLTDAEVRDLFLRAGASVSVRIERDTGLLDRTLKLRRLI